MISFFALIVLAALLVWAVGGALARVVGGVLVLSELARLVLDGGSTRTLALLAAGLALWLAGHWHHASKHGLWRSSLGLRVWSLPVLYRLAPIPTNHRPRHHDEAWV